jgi:peptidoglycan/xylan/chitin deacetylase (PgdA/CDA1 family)
LLTPAEIDFLAHHEVSHGDSSRPVILMTYDDGGRDAYVEMILQAYASLNARATFFIPGFWMANHSKTAEDIVAHGHLLGCHSYNHTAFTGMTKDAINQDIDKFLKLADQVLPGYRIRYFRFPYGDRNQDVRDIVAQWGMQSVMWDVESGGLTDSTYSAVVDHVSNGSLVLSHSSRYYDAKQAGQIVQELLKRGYSIETVATGMAPQDQWKN